MKLLSVLLLFATTWVMAIAWRKDLNDNLFQEYLENENQANPSDRFRLPMEKIERDDEASPSVQPVPASYQESAVLQDESEFRPIYSLDMRIPSQNCPSSLQLRVHGDLRLCGKRSNGAGCDSVTIPTNGQSYSKVLGKVKAYQFGSPDCFASHPQNINSYYVDGISITYGTPRKHVWTYAAAWRQFIPGNNPRNTCPSTGAGDGPWNFVGDDYFCSSGNPGPSWSAVLYTKYPLWSNIQGDCSFCGKNDLSFCRELEASTTDNLELRICTDERLNNEDIRIETIEFYID